MGSSGIQIIDYHSFLNIPRLIPNPKRSSSRFQISDDEALFKETILELLNLPWPRVNAMSTQRDGIPNVISTFTFTFSY